MTSACEPGPDVPHASKPEPTKPHYELAPQRRHLVPIPCALEYSWKIDSTTSGILPSIQKLGWGSPWILRTNMSGENNRNSIPSASTPSSVVEQLQTSPMTCHVCGKSFNGEYSKGNLSRHQRLKHDGLERDYPCLVPGCAKTYHRQDARLKHYREKHPELEIEEPRRRK